MPTYEYKCADCGANLEIVQSIHDPSLTVCPECGAEALRKQFGNVGVVFKGSGFYKTDSRSANTKSKSGSKPAGGSSDKADKPKKAEGTTTAKSESKSTPVDNSSSK